MSTSIVRRMIVRDKDKTAADAESADGPRRSRRNLPAHLKENVEAKPAAEKEPDISTLPFINFNGHINYANDFHNCAMICDELINEVNRCPNEIIPVGFDLEWPFSFQTGSGKTALAQICLSETACHLLHLYKLQKLPAAFVILLTHPRVRLVGVNIKNDVWKLGRDFKEFPAQQVVKNNCIDCGPFANRVLNRSVKWSLERLTAYVLRKRISKDPEVRRSKWHIQPLSKAQLHYAATDAYVSLLLHMSIQKRADLLTEIVEGNSEINVKNSDEKLNAKYKLREVSVVIKKITD